MDKVRYMIFLLVTLLALCSACNEPEDILEGVETDLPELIAPGNDDFQDAQSPEDLDFSRVGYRWSDMPIPEYPVGTAEECADMIHEFEPIARAIVALNDLKIISFGPRPLNFLNKACLICLYSFHTNISLTK